MASSSSVGESEAQRPVNVSLRPFDPSSSTEDLMDCWRILLRSSVDAAILDPPNRNVFAFAEACIYFATVHDLDYHLKEHAKAEKERMDNEVEDEDLDMKPRPYKPWIKDFDFLAPARGNTITVPPREEEDSCWSDGDHDMNDLSVTPYHYPSSPSANNTVQSASHDDAAYRQDAPPIPEIDGIPFVSDSASAWRTQNRQQPDLIGIAYLIPSSGAASAACEVSLGLALLPHARGMGFGTETVRKLMELAFDEFKFHRVSAGVLGPGASAPLKPPSEKTPARSTNAAAGKNALTSAQVEGMWLSGTLAETEAALRMFVAVGLTIEGVRRRAVPDLEDNGAWRDAHYLSMLDTDWIAFQKRPRRSRWDEMLARHNSETEALATAESRLKRSASTETLRPSNGATIEISYAPSVTDSSAASECGAVVEQRQPIASRHSSASSSVSLPLSNPFRDPLIAHRAPVQRFFLSSDNRSQSEGDGSELDYGEVRYDAEHISSLNKVEGFLRANPAPGPPPSEIGSNLDSDAEYESCADDDELDLLKDTKGKEKAKSASIEEQEPLLPTVKSAQVMIQKTPTVLASPNLASEADEQTRKKRRLSKDDETTNWSDVANASADVESSSAGASDTSCLKNAGDNARISDANNTMDFGSDTSDAETVSTAESTSTWDVVSGGTRSPSPSPSLSSATDSLSLQSVHESEDE